MRPGPGVPAQSPDWRAYRILELRYIDVLSPKEVMQEIALGRSQYFQEQARVLEALIDRLWNQWQDTYLDTAEQAETSHTSREQLIHLETRRLQDQARWELVNITELLKALRGVIEPLAKARNVSIEYHLPNRLKDLYLDRVMLRQAILNAVTCALDLARNGYVTIKEDVEERQEGLRIVAHPLSDAARHPETGLDVCRQLVEALGGTLSPS
jgi:signal transduction histidine kinase